MKKLVALVMVVVLVGCWMATGAHGAQVDSGTGQGAGWSVTVPGVGTTSLTPQSTAAVPSGCGAGPCENHDSDQLVNVQFPPGSLTPAAKADVLSSSADAYRDAAAVATLQTLMDNASPLNLPTPWNTHGYGRLEGFSALNGRIIADTLEAETVSGTRPDNNGDPIFTTASGSRVVNLRLAKGLEVFSLAPIIPDKPNQELLNQAGVKIVFWETNWNPTTGTTTDGQAVWVNTLHITDSVTGIDIKAGQSQSDAVYTAPPAPSPSATPSASASPSASPSATPSASPTDLPTALPSATPTDLPTALPSATPTDLPTALPSATPTDLPTALPSATPTDLPTASPSATPTDLPTASPSATPTDLPTALPSVTPTALPTIAPPAAQNPPVANDDSGLSTGAPVVVQVDANDTDLDGDLDPSTTTLATPPLNGVASCSNGSCTYGPIPGFSGIDSFTYQICDSQGACATATVIIFVTAPLPPIVPLPTPTPTPTPTATPTATPSATPDPTPDPTVTPDPTPDPTADPTVAPTVSASPAASASPSASAPAPGPSTSPSSAPIVGAVSPPSPPANNPPVAVDDSQSSTGAPVTIVVDGNDSDPDGDLDPSTVTVVTSPLNGSVTCSNGTCTYTPNPGFNGIDSFVYQICDTQGSCDTAAVILFITSPVPVVDGPMTTVPDPNVKGRDDIVLPDPQDGSGLGKNPIGPGSGPGDDGSAGNDPITPADPTHGGGGGGGGASNKPIFGFPGADLPFTGAGHIAFYLAIALNLMVLGGLIMLANSIRTRMVAAATKAQAHEETFETVPVVEVYPAPARTSPKKTTVAKTIRYSKKQPRRA
jgi:hypothetical protein